MESKINEKILNLIVEYLNATQDIETIRKSKNKNYLIFIGLNSVLHIFKLILFKTNDVKLAYIQSQKGYYFFIEYIEQIENLDLSYNLNNIDAIKFMYSKTLNNDDPILPDVFLNYTLTDFQKTQKTIFILLQLENNYFTTENRINIIKVHLLNYLQYSTIFIDGLNDLMEKIEMDITTYFLFLQKYAKSIEKNEKRGIVLDKNEFFNRIYEYLSLNSFAPLCNKNTQNNVISLLTNDDNMVVLNNKIYKKFDDNSVSEIIKIIFLA
jgi:hypothetical protein